MSKNNFRITKPAISMPSIELKPLTSKVCLAIRDHFGIHPGPIYGHFRVHPKSIRSHFEVHPGPIWDLSEFRPGDKFHNSPNSCMQHEVLAVTLLTDCGWLVLPRAEEPHVCHKFAVPLIFSTQHFSESCSGCMELKITHCSICFEITIASKCCCGSCSTQNEHGPFLVPYHKHHSKTLVIANSCWVQDLCFGTSSCMILEHQE